MAAFLNDPKEKVGLGDLIFAGDVEEGLIGRNV